MAPILTREQWLEQKAAHEAFNRWEEENPVWLDIREATQVWSDLWALYRRLRPDDPPLDPEKYEHLAKVRRALAHLK